jgi:hypothetical protein
VVGLRPPVHQDVEGGIARADREEGQAEQFKHAESKRPKSGVDASQSTIPWLAPAPSSVAIR